MVGVKISTFTIGLYSTISPQGMIRLSLEKSSFEFFNRIGQERSIGERLQLRPLDVIPSSNLDIPNGSRHDAAMSSVFIQQKLRLYD